MSIAEYERIYGLVEQLSHTLCQLEKEGNGVPCIQTNVKMLKTHLQMLAVELGCEKI